MGYEPFSESIPKPAFAGERPTGGHAIEIVRIEDNAASQSLVIVVRESRPRPGAMVTQALTQSHHLVRLKRSARPARFILARPPD